MVFKCVAVIFSKVVVNNMEVIKWNVSKLKVIVDIFNCKDIRNVCLIMFVYFNSIMFS